jgi:hypothetical protein
LVSPTERYEYLKAAVEAAHNDVEEAQVLKVEAMPKRTGEGGGSARMARELQTTGRAGAHRQVCTQRGTPAP